MIRIRTTLSSDTPHLPELAPLVGRPVVVTVEEEPARTGPPHPDTVAAAERAIQELHDTGFDFSVYDRLDEIERRAAERLGRGE
jgi:hypothetical protein